MLRILLIAPRMEDLPSVDDEVAAIVNAKGISVELMSGEVTRKDIVRAITDEKFDVLWFASHGSLNGIRLSDGNLDRASLITYIRSGSIRYAVINTCESFMIANDLAESAFVDVIATIGTPLDKSAYEFGALLAKHLSDGKDFRSAYRLAKPEDNDKYIYLSGSLTKNGNQTRSSVEHLEREMHRMAALIDGDPGYGVSGIRKDLSEILRVIQVAKEERDALREELSEVAYSLRDLRNISDMLLDERAERKATQAHLEHLASAIEKMSEPHKQPKYYEWVIPVMGFLTISTFILVLSRLI